jgi:integrase
MGSMLAEHSLKPNSIRGYSGAMKKFEQEFCRGVLGMKGELRFPVPLESINLYITWLGEQHRGFSVPSTFLHSIKWAHEIRGLKNPWEGKEITRRLRKAVRRLAPKNDPRARRPVTEGEVKKLITECEKRIKKRGDNWHRLAVMICVGFEGGLRFSEMQLLRFRDITWTPEGMQLFLRDSKGDEFADGRKTSAFKGRGKGSARKAIKDFRLARDIRKNSRLPVFNRYGTHKAISNKSCTKGMVIAATSIGMDIRKLGLHSLRKGAAVKRYQEGWTVPEIRTFLRHKPGSKSVFIYVPEAIKDLVVNDVLLRSRPE